MLEVLIPTQNEYTYFRLDFTRLSCPNLVKKCKTLLFNSETLQLLEMKYYKRSLPI